DRQRLGTGYRVLGTGYWVLGTTSAASPSPSAASWSRPVASPPVLPEPRRRPSTASAGSARSSPDCPPPDYSLTNQPPYSLRSARPDICSDDPAPRTVVAT